MDLRRCWDETGTLRLTLRVRGVAPLHGAMERHDHRPISRSLPISFSPTPLRLTTSSYG